MKKLLPLLLIFNFQLSIFNSSAQTNVSGFINANTTWTLAGSPYIVVGNALLSQGYTLTIEPGVVVKFNSQKALQIDGELMAIGTAIDRITFTSNQITPAAGDWAKIHFSDTCVDAQYDSTGNYLSGCIMKYCDILYGGDLGYGIIHIENSHPYFSKCLVAYSAYDGIYCSGGSYKLDSSTVRNCTNVGLDFYFATPQNCSLVIRNDTIRDNNGGGIFFSGSVTCPGPLPVVNISNSYFNANAGWSAIYQNDGIPKIVISSNVFESNICHQGGGVLNLKSGTKIIECNRFVNNQGSNTALSCGIYIVGTSTNSYIQNNLFDSNITLSTNPSASVITILENFYPDIYLLGNVFRNNVVASGSICRLIGSGSNSSITRYHIRDNEFQSNQNFRDLYLSATLADFSLPFANIANNNFVNTNSQYVIYNNSPYGGVNIDADSNYWGSTSTSYVDSVIYDYFDYANQSVVYYNPILTSQADVDTSCDLTTNLYPIIDKENTFLIYPNPTQNTFTISFNEYQSKNAELKIFELTGREVHKQRIDNNQSTIINCNFSAGVYFVKVSDGNREEVQKLVIE
jgi:hypothetical protein